MRKYIYVSLVLMLFGLVILWAGCAGPRTESPATQSITGTAGVPGAGTTIAPPPEVSVPVPEWFLNIPEDPNYMYAVGTALSKDMQNANDTAKQSCREDIASQMETKLTAMFKRFMEEVGSGEDSELTAMTTAVSKAVVSQLLQRTKVAKQDIKWTGSRYRSYVLMELPIGEMNASALNKIKEQKNMYTRFRASQGFAELEEEVAKYEAFKKEQEQQQGQIQ